MAGENDTRRVKFQKLELKEYPYELGDNPSTYDGPPLTIAWKPQMSMICDIEVFEGSLDDDDKPTRRKTQEELSIPGYERVRLLQRSGFSNSEIESVIEECRKIQESRARSIDNMHWDFLAAVAESSSSFLSETFSRFRGSRFSK